MLHIHALTYTYQTPDTKQTYRFNLEMQAGQVTAILGESGSGKSTMLDILSGFLQAESGSVILNNIELLPLAIEKRPITILFQKHNLFEHLNVEKNILLGIHDRAKANSQEKQQCSQILTQMGLAGFGRKMVTELSGGQQQRVALARALLRKKPILLLDEPFTGLDRETRLEMLALVQRITRENSLHTLMVTHETEDCELIADSVYKMKDGTLLPHITLVH